jgi:molybdopterin molybdotransferase
MAEYTEKSGDLVLVKRAVAAGENVLRRGEDFSAGQVVLQTGRVLSPQDLGVLAALGFATVCCSRLPKVGVISTGNEVVPVDATPTPGQVRDVNTYLCTAFLQRHGCRPLPYGIVRDDPQEFARTLERAAGECDAVLVSGGSSKDVRDMVSDGIAFRGKVLVHGIGIQPGKPTIIGTFGTIPVVGLPGHPASAFIVLLACVRTLIAALSGRRDAECRVPARLTQNIPSPRGRVDYVRVKVADGRVTPLFGKSGLLNNLVESAGVVCIGADREGAEAGEEVEVILW